MLLNKFFFCLAFCLLFRWGATIYPCLAYRVGIFQFHAVVPPRGRHLAKCQLWTRLGLGIRGVPRRRRVVSLSAASTATCGWVYLERVGGCSLARWPALINLVPAFALRSRAQKQSPTWRDWGAYIKTIDWLTVRIHYPKVAVQLGIGTQPTCQRCLWLTVSCNWLWWIYCCQFDKSMQPGARWLYRIAQDRDELIGKLSQG